MHRILPAPALRAHVQAYWFVVDLDGRQGLAPVVTAPHTAAVLALNLGRPSRSPFAVGAPVAGLVGLQSQARSYQPQAGTFLVMAMLSPLGQARLFPHSGEAAKALALIDRLQHSLRAAQQGGADPAEGYSDQAHQIRAWRRGLGLTPGAYRRQAPSAMAQAFAGAELAHFM